MQIKFSCLKSNPQAIETDNLVWQIHLKLKGFFLNLVVSYLRINPKSSSHWQLQYYICQESDLRHTVVSGNALDPIDLRSRSLNNHLTSEIFGGYLIKLALWFLGWGFLGSNLSSPFMKHVKVPGPFWDIQINPFMLLEVP